MVNMCRIRCNLHVVDTLKLKGVITPPDPIRSDPTQLDATGQSGRVESDRKSDHTESGDVITLTILPD